MLYIVVVIIIIYFLFLDSMTDFVWFNVLSKKKSSSVSNDVVVVVVVLFFFEISYFYIIVAVVVVCCMCVCVCGNEIPAKMYPSENDYEAQLTLASKLAAARELFEETGIDVRNQLDRVIRAGLRPMPMVSAKSKHPILVHEHKRRLFYYLNVTDNDFLSTNNNGEGITTAKSPSCQLKLRLSHEHESFTFQQDPNTSIEMLQMHSGGKISEALRMSLAHSLPPLSPVSKSNGSDKLAAVHDCNVGIPAPPLTEENCNVNEEDIRNDNKEDSNLIQQNESTTDNNSNTLDAITAKVTTILELTDDTGVVVENTVCSDDKKDFTTSISTPKDDLIENSNKCLESNGNVETTKDGRKDDNTHKKYINEKYREDLLLPRPAPKNKSWFCFCY